MSGYTDDRTLRFGIERVDVPFIQKPFSPCELTLAVRRVLDEPSWTSECS